MNVIYDGTAHPAPEQTMLQAGQLTMVYQNGMLRYIRLGEHEILRGIYAAVRDENWHTIPANLHKLEIQTEDNAFHIRFECEHHQDNIHFFWRGEIVGSSDSRLRFQFDGEALTDFRRNRIGFCVLHPADAAGKPLRIEHINGDVETGRFPDAIQPHQPFKDIRAIAYEVTPAVWTEVLMEGDSFEMEDQRNWSDASFKTYCTPLGLPFPVQIEAGFRVQQRISLTLQAPPQAIPAWQAAPPQLTVHTESSKPIPRIGFCAASHGESLTARQVELLKLLYPAHLRIDLSENCDIATVLEQIWTEAEALGAEIEIALHLGSDATSRLARLRETADVLQIHGRLLIFDTESPSMSHDMIKAARAAFADYPYTLPIGGGTNAYFTELNRSRPQAEALDWVAFSVNPQVHAFDNDSLVETLPILATIVDNARVIAAGKPIAVSPLTLKPRWNPSATTPVESTTQSQGLPTQVDVRQMSLFGAGWTLGSLAYLAGAQALTYFETTGWLGLMQRSEATLTDQFPAPSGVVYPMYHVFAAMAEFAGGEQATLGSSDPLQSNGLVLRKDGRLRLLLANHRPTAIKVTVSGLKGEFQLTSLDESTGDEAMHTPEVYRASPGRRFRIEGDTLLELLPYAVAKLDQIL